MKKLLIITTSVIYFTLLNGCGTTIYFDKQIVVYGYDFTKYTDKNFLFTPEQYLGEYESIGLLEVELYPESRKISVKGSNQYGASNYGETDKWIYEPITTEEILDSLYSTSLRMGANAISRLKIEAFPISYGLVYWYGKKASGFAIRRK